MISPRTRCALRQERMTAEDATDIPEGDKEHQTDQQDEAHEVDDALPSRGAILRPPRINSISTKKKRPPSSAGSGNRFRTPG